MKYSQPTEVSVYVVGKRNYTSLPSTMFSAMAVNIWKRLDKREAQISMHGCVETTFLKMSFNVCVKIATPVGSAMGVFVHIKATLPIAEATHRAPRCGQSRLLYS